MNNKVRQKPSGYFILGYSAIMNYQPVKEKTRENNVRILFQNSRIEKAFFVQGPKTL